MKKTYHYKNIMYMIFAAGIPIILFVILFLFRFRGYFISAADTNLQSLRDEKINLIKEHYSKVEEKQEIYSQTIALSILGGKGELVNGWDFNSYDKNSEIKNIYVFDTSYNLIYKKNSDPDVINAADTLKQYKFKEPFILSDFFTTSSQNYQYLYYKISNKSGALGYTVFKIDSSQIQLLLKNSKQLGVKIYNNKFQVVCDTDVKNINKTEITPITKKALDGNTDIEAYEGYRYAYSFIDLNGVALYIAAYNSEKNILGTVNNIRTFILFVIILTFIAIFVLGWKAARNLKEAIEDELNNIENNTSLHIDELSKKANKVLKHITDIENLYEPLSKLREDLNEFEDEVRKEGLHINEKDKPEGKT
ncbi:hypothetical protein [Clostridium manihotivorum]|uniref:Cache domain-containing protein n=1 Tax=Clostridium manihotivorum TaxID=2320868 RepID=A0A410DV45_9CLOT|nr:hypothetical protein [Clostridium manihotivorum]QAA32935.1 hypothetical protein C1I91_15525 [Clostridium manihotivorum]